jgi:hypothetical protein
MMSLHFYFFVCLVCEFFLCLL